MSEPTPGTRPGTYTTEVHGYTVDITRGEDGVWHAALHQAPHITLARGHLLGPVESALEAMTHPQLRMMAGGPPRPADCDEPHPRSVEVRCALEERHAGHHWARSGARWLDPD